MSDDVLRIAIYGKGGIGKSVVATNLSASFGLRGLKVLHVGCDPKADSAVRLMEDGERIRTVLEVLGDKHIVPSVDLVLNRGRLGIDTCEAGGPKPGLGCGGRGVARTLEFLDDMEILEDDRYDLAVFDVLGDVVCGGFAAPLRKGFGDQVYIVLSEEPMAVYAANNIASAVATYERNGVKLGGLIGNLKLRQERDLEMLDEFARRLKTQVVGYIPRDPAVIAAERHRTTVVEESPDSPAAQAFQRLADHILDARDLSPPTPTPMERDEFYDFLESW